MFEELLQGLENATARALTISHASQVAIAKGLGIPQATIEAENQKVVNAITTIEGNAAGTVVQTFLGKLLGAL